MQHEYWMQQALEYACAAEKNLEVPVGAIVVYENEIIGAGCNSSIALHDPTAHAEIIALRKAAAHLKNYRLINTTLYVTLEPCAMCAGAMIHARISNLVYAASDPRSGAVTSVFKILDDKNLNHRVKWRHGVLADESSKILKTFFRNRRLQK